MQKDISLKHFSKLHVGGKTKYFVHVTSSEQLFNVLRFANDNDLPWYIIGFGSNIIIDDATFNGVVIKLAEKFKKFCFSNKAVCCGAGVPLIKLGQLLAAKGFSGYEYMAVIPGTIGGAVLMNAGTTNHGVISDHFIRAFVLEPTTEKIIEYKKEDMNFDYRYTKLQNLNNIILDVEFRLDLESITSSKQIKSTISDIWKNRLAKQPKIRKNFGSVFKKPYKKKPAGWYLDQVCMKGLKIGDAGVPHEHANWIVNMGNATAKDVKAIIDIATQRVFDEFGIILEREVIYLPEDTIKWK